MEIVSDYLHREFGFCKILWKIEHFCLVTCKNNWEISSPVFSVRAPCLTTWTMTLKSKPRENANADCVISVSLKRLESDPGPDTVMANWKMGVLNGNRNEYDFFNVKHYFSKNTAYQQDLLRLNDILKEFQPFETDVLCIQCQLLVSFDNSSKFNTCGEQGIRSLSDDLFELYSSRKSFDVTLKVKDEHVLAHKAILYARNPTFAKILDSNPVAYLIDLCPPISPDSHVTKPFINSCDVEKIIAYLYSGNLEFVVGEPSISIYECALMFDISEVIQYYIPDELTLQSTVDAEEMIFLWIIRDFESSINQCILSPLLTETTSDTIWRLRLLPKGEEYCSEYISIFAEITEGMKPQEVCLEFAVTNVNHEFSNHRRIQKSVGLGGILGFSDFVRRDSLKGSSFLENGILRVVFKLKVFAENGNRTSSCEIDSTSAVTADAAGQTFELLSEDLSCLLEDGKFSDAAVYCGDKVFNVHKCVLNARSDTLSNILREKLKDRNETFFADVEPEIFEILLSYIYSGTLVDFNSDLISKIYKSAEDFKMYGLMTKSLQIYNNVKKC